MESINKKKEISKKELVDKFLILVDAFFYLYDFFFGDQSILFSLFLVDGIFSWRIFLVDISFFCWCIPYSPWPTYEALQFWHFKCNLI